MKRKIVKTYEAFIDDKSINKHFKFEENIIDPILSCIRDNQEYLTQPENLPQLAKLGYIYNTLWYDGRICWGYDGILRGNAKTTDEDGEETGYSDCEDNPKYKIEMCNPHNDDIENLIYDAWAMHVMDSEGKSHVTADDFFDIIYKGKPLTDLEIKMLKVNKTFDEWVEIKTDKNYRYKSLYPDRRSVADHLLCTIGNGYGWNRDGFIIEEAGGADQDKAMYGDWQNAKFSPEIKKVVDKVLSYPEVKKTIEAAHDYIESVKRKRKEEEDKRWKGIRSIVSGDSDDDEISDEELDKIIKSIYNKKFGKTETEEYKEPYRQYYPISSSSDIYAILSDEKRNRIGVAKFDQSYIDAAIEICKEIMEHESEERKGNVDFAKKLLNKYKIANYDVPKEIDKYALLNDIQDAFLYITDNFTKKESNSQLQRGEYTLYLNDTRNSDYADNNYYFRLSLKGYNLPKGYSNNIEYLKPISIYDEVKSTLNRLSQLKDIKVISTYVNNGPSDKPELIINMYVNNNKHQLEKLKFDDEFVKKGFQVGSNALILETNDYILYTGKPDILGSSHPNSKPGYEFFNTNKPFIVYGKGWNKVCDFMIDERGFNTISSTRGGQNEINRKIKEEFNKMKLSNPDYGLYGIKGDDRKYEGKLPLYAHDFMLWLKNNGF